MQLLVPALIVRQQNVILYQRAQHIIKTPIAVRVQITRLQMLRYIVMIHADPLQRVQQPPELLLPRAAVLQHPPREHLQRLRDRNAQPLVLHEIHQLLRRQVQHLVTVNNIVQLRREHRVERRHRPQVVLPHEIEYQQAIIEAERFLEELGAVIDDAVHDEVVREPQQLLDVRDVYRYLPGVHVHDERVENVAVEAADRQLLLDDLVLLEDRVEVRRVAGEDVPVDLERLAVDVEREVAEATRPLLLVQLPEYDGWQLGALERDVVVLRHVRSRTTPLQRRGCEKRACFRAVSLPSAV